MTDHILSELEALVAVSSPSGDSAGAEAAIALCLAFLPEAGQVERLPCSTPGFADDLQVTVAGRGRRRLLLLGHIDTVIRHDAHAPLRHEAGKLYGPGTADMKGGVAVALAVARALASDPAAFAQLSVLLVCDEEWRTEPFRHVERFAEYDACLCFEAGERGERGDAIEEGVIVRRKGAGTLRVGAAGRAAHSGSAPQDGRNALLALARVAGELAALADPHGATQLTVVPTILRAGEALNVVPPSGELVFDMRAADTDAFRSVHAAVPDQIDGVELSATMERVWPAMDTQEATAELLAAASERLGRPIVPRARGGASDASHFAPAIPLTVDGLGPRGGGAHTHEEFVHEASLGERLEVALAIARAALEM